MPLNAALIAELKHESSNTRKMLERVPADKLNWAPHEKSMLLGRLASHVADLPAWFERVINHDEFDFAAPRTTSYIKDSTEEILKAFDDRLAEALAVMENATDENLNSTWTVRNAEKVMFQMPKKVALRSFAYNHLYHRRGQLSVYLRLLDIPVPGMYGPSADERI